MVMLKYAIPLVVTLISGVTAAQPAIKVEMYLDQSGGGNDWVDALDLGYASYNSSTKNVVINSVPTLDAIADEAIRVLAASSPQTTDLGTITYDVAKPVTMIVAASFVFDLNNPLFAGCPGINYLCGTACLPSRAL